MPKRHDLAGRRFGRLVALRPTDRRSGRQVVWECRCDCGRPALVRTGDLLRGDTRSCGCLLAEHAARMRPRLDLAGRRFGRLVALRPAGAAPGPLRGNGCGGVPWECRCDCGRTVVVRTNGLRTGTVKSCGCLPRGRRPARERG